MNVKRVLSLLLAMAMVFSMLPMSVLADELGTPAEGTAIVGQVEEKKEESAEEPAAEEPVVEEPTAEEPVPTEPVGGNEGEEQEPAAEDEESQTTEGDELVAEGETIAEAPAVMMLAARKPDNKDDELVDNGDADDHGNNGNHGQKICGERLTTKDDVQDVVLTESDKNKKVIITGTQKVVCPVHGEYDVTESVYVNVKKGDDEESLKKAGEAEIKKMLEGSKCKKGAEPDNDSGSTTNLEDIALKLVVDGETAAETGYVENQEKYGFFIPSLVNPENNEGMVFVSVDADAYYIEKIVLGGKSFTEDDAISGIEFNDDQCDIDVWALCEDEENGINEINSITAYVKTKQTAEGFAASIINDLPDTVKFFSYENENEEYETGYKTKRNGTAGYTDVNGIDAAVKVDSEIIKDILVQFYEDTEANYTGKKSDWADYLKKAWTSNNENGININEDDLGALLDIDAESMGKFNEYEWYILKKHCDVNAWHMDGVAKPKYSVKYVVDDVTINESEPTVEGTVITVIDTIPTKEGSEFVEYVFAGWATTKGGEVEYKAGETFELTDDVTLHAVFNKNVYGTVRYYVDGELVETSEKVLVGVDVPVTENTYSKADNQLISYEFAGWADAESNKVGDTVQMIEGGIDLYPVFEEYRTVYFSVRAGKEMKDAEGNMIAPYMAPAELDSTE